MLLACIGHDLKHPGIGNSYFAKAKHRYFKMSDAEGSQSVLEFYSYKLLMELIEKT